MAVPATLNFYIWVSRLHSNLPNVQHLFHKKSFFCQIKARWTWCQWRGSHLSISHHVITCAGDAVASLLWGLSSKMLPRRAMVPKRRAFLAWKLPWRQKCFASDQQGKWRFRKNQAHMSWMRKAKATTLRAWCLKIKKKAFLAEVQNGVPYNAILNFGDGTLHGSTMLNI